MNEKLFRWICGVGILFAVLGVVLSGCGGAITQERTWKWNGPVVYQYDSVHAVACYFYADGLFCVKDVMNGIIEPKWIPTK